jgi:excinuclease ABC subunit C
MNAQLELKLKDLPKEPGVYFHKNKAGKIIYVGKAAVLRNRVRQYFQKSRARDPKTEALVAEIYDTDWMVVESELEALFLEAEMIRRYMPQYNILLRDDKSMTYIRIDYDSDYPTVTMTRRPLDDGAKYFGPYFSAFSVKKALRVLRKIFPYAVKKPGGEKRATLYYHLGLDPGLEEGKTSLEDYRACLRKLMAVIQGKRTNILRELEKEMKAYAKASDFENAAKTRNRLFALQNLNKQVIFSDKEFMDISKDHALGELVDLLSMPKFPQRIEGYDISHMQGTDVVASMVVFTNGVSNKGEYRKFKTKKDQNNDFYNMHETLSRRLSEKNVKAWGLPNLVLIDGGKGQLDAAIRARDEAGYSKIPFIGLAKREEQIVIKKSYEQAYGEWNKAHEKAGELAGAIMVAEGGSVESLAATAFKAPDRRKAKSDSNVELNKEVLQKLGGFATESDDFILTNVPHSTNLVKLLQRIRDESHRFAVSYHSVLKVKRQTASMLDDIPTIGPATRKKLLKTFGSMRGVMQARDIELEKLLGDKKATILKQYLRPLKQEAKLEAQES